MITICPGALNSVIYNSEDHLIIHQCISNTSSPSPLLVMVSSTPSDAKALSKGSIVVADANLSSNFILLPSNLKVGPIGGVTTSADLVCEEDSRATFTNLFFRRFYKPIDLDAIATRRSVYDDPDLASHYWPKKEYENLHRFDPNARWTYREEQVIFHPLSYSQTVHSIFIF